MLRQISQNFPKYASALARRVPEPPEEFLEETAAVRMQLPQGFSGLWINGLVINEGDVNPLRCGFTSPGSTREILNTSHNSLLRIMRAERKRMISLEELGLSPAQAVGVISWSPPRAAANGQETTLEGYFDASDRVEGGDVIIWWNNLEKDTRYSHWPASLTGVSPVPELFALDIWFKCGNCVLAALRGIHVWPVPNNPEEFVQCHCSAGLIDAFLPGIHRKSYYYDNFKELAFQMGYCSECGDGNWYRVPHSSC